MTTTTVAVRWAEGYADATGWLPAATPDELRELFDLESGKGTVFIYPGHTLAGYWHYHGPRDQPAGDVDPWDPYGRGFYAALHDHLEKTR